MHRCRHGARLRVGREVASKLTYADVAKTRRRRGSQAEDEHEHEEGDEHGHQLDGDASGRWYSSSTTRTADTDLQESSRCRTTSARTPCRCGRSLTRTTTYHEPEPRWGLD